MYYLDIIYIVFVTICAILLVFNIALLATKNASYSFFNKAIIQRNDGAFTERKIYQAFNAIPFRKYGVPNLILISDDKCKSTELDLVLLLKSGLYVVEAKNKRGIVFGDATSTDNWKVFGTAHDFSNPVIQNDIHISQISYYLKDKISEDEIKKIVCFDNRAITCFIKNKKARRDVSFLHVRSFWFFLMINEIKACFSKTKIAKDRIKEIGKWLINTQLENQKFADIHNENVAHNHNEQFTNNINSAQNATSNIQNSKFRDIDPNKIAYIKELASDGMSIKDIAAVTFLDDPIIESILTN